PQPKPPADGVRPLQGAVPYPQPDGTRPKLDRPVLASDACRFVGEPIAMVLAETLMQARDAAEAVAVDYQAGDAVAPARDALHPGAAPVWTEAPDNIAFVWQAGDAEMVAAET